MSAQDHIGIPEDDLVGWWRAHAAHLRGDPFELCVPAFNGSAYAPVEISYEVVGEPGERDEPGARSAPDSRSADWDCWPEITLVGDGTRAFVNVSVLAHHRECAEASCIAVWHKGNERLRKYGERTFVFAPPPIVAGRFTPTLVPVDACAGRLKHLRWTGMTVDELPPIYEVTPGTADDLRAERTPRARPIDADQYVR